MENSPRPRKPQFALAMSLMLPGFGQMYNGELNKAIWLFLCFALLSVPGVVLVGLYLPAGLMLPSLVLALFLTLALWTYAAIDAWRDAKRKQNHVVRPWQLSGVYVLTLLLCDGLTLPLLIGYVRAHQVASFRIPSRSMEPSIAYGDVLFADMRYNCPGCKGAVRRGDVAIFTYPNDRTMSYIKRVIALPGDHVRVAGTTIWVNGKPLNVREARTPSGVLVTEAVDGRQWQVQWTPAAKPAQETELTVPPGHAFVLGDNRSVSVDGRDFGPVPLHDIVGRARQIWFSSAAPDGVRWSRLGRLVE